MKTRTLKERVRASKLGVYPFHGIVRAELQRVARQVRKLYPESGGWRCFEEALSDDARERALNAVLAILKEAQR